LQVGEELDRVLGQSLCPAPGHLRLLAEQALWPSCDDLRRQAVRRIGVSETMPATDRSAKTYGVAWPRSPLFDPRRLPAAWRAIFPGFLVSATIAMAASWLAQHYNTPVMLFALLLGMAFHFLHEEGRCVAGIEFSSKAILRIGVGLL